MALEDQIRERFPSIDEISDPELQEKVVDVWVDAIENSDFDSPDDIPWSKDAATEGEGKGQHTYDVAELAIALTDKVLELRDVEVDRDTVIAGALLHDASKAYELSGMEQWLPHPYYGIHMAAKAGLSPHIQHIILSHTPKTAVMPGTIEAQIIQKADLVGVQALYKEKTGDIIDIE